MKTDLYVIGKLEYLKDAIETAKKHKQPTESLELEYKFYSIRQTFESLITKGLEKYGFNEEGYKDVGKNLQVSLTLDRTEGSISEICYIVNIGLNNESFGKYCNRDLDWNKIDDVFKVIFEHISGSNPQTIKLALALNDKHILQTTIYGNRKYEGFSNTDELKLLVDKICKNIDDFTNCEDFLRTCASMDMVVDETIERDEMFEKKYEDSEEVE